MCRILSLIALTALLVQCKQEMPNESAANASELTELNGTSLYIREIGQGPALIIVHGGPGFGHQYLFEHFENLKSDYRLIFYDQRASGRSAFDQDSTEISLELFIEDIDAIRELYKLRKIHLLGHSFGGLLAMQYAFRYPERVDRLVLVSSIAPASEVNQRANTKIANMFSASDLEKRVAIMRSKDFQQGEPNAFEELMKIGFKYQFYDTSSISKLKLSLPADFRQRSSVLQWLGPDLAKFDYSEDLKTLESPVLLIYGEVDPLNQFALPILINSIPEVKHFTLDKSGHFPFIEQSEETLKLVSDFLQ